MNRRVFLRAGLLAPLGLGLADALRLRSAAQAAPARAGAAKACILLYMTGGPAQHETFDPKPNAPVEKSIRNIAHALLSGADGWMFDGEDALGQVSTMSLDNQRNLKLAIHRDPFGKTSLAER